MLEATWHFWETNYSFGGGTESFLIFDVKLPTRENTVCLTIIENAHGLSLGLFDVFRQEENEHKACHDSVLEDLETQWV